MMYFVMEDTANFELPKFLIAFSTFSAKKARYSLGKRHWKSVLFHYVNA